MRHKRGYHYRCSRSTCQKRYTFLHLVEWYVREKICRVTGDTVIVKSKVCKCGSIKFRRDHYRERTERGVKPCTCDGYGHMALREVSPPHRIGSRCCFYRKDGSRRLMGDPDWFDPQMERESSVPGEEDDASYEDEQPHRDDAVHQ